MTLKRLNADLTVCKVRAFDPAVLNQELFFISKTADECSLVCPTANVPAETTARDDGWDGFYIDGTLDFGLIGILSKITDILANAGVGIFAVSTFNTDYILVKKENLDYALSRLEENGYRVE